MVMRVRALRTFNSKEHGLIREGQIVTINDSYAKKLILTKPPLVEQIVVEHVPRKPDNDKSVPGPDRTKDDEGNDKRDDVSADSSRSTNGDETSHEPDPESGATENSSEDPPVGGRGRRSSSQPRARRSRRSR